MSFRDMAFAPGTPRPDWMVSDVPENVLTAFGRRGREPNGRAGYYRRTSRGLHVGENAMSSGDLSLAIGPFSYAGDDEAVASGAYARAEGRRSTTVGNRSRAAGSGSTHVGQGGVTTGINATTVGQGSVNTGKNATLTGQGSTVQPAGATGVGQFLVISGASATGATAVGFNVSISGSSALATIVGSSAQIVGLFSTQIGAGGTIVGSGSIGIGVNTIIQHADSFVAGNAAQSGAANQITWGAGSGSGYFSETRTFVGANGQAFKMVALTELTTIAAAAFTDTAIQIPADAQVLAVSVRVTVAIPTAATFDVGINGATTRYGTGILVAANTTNDGTNDGLRYYAAATAIRITPDLTPAADTGRVRVTVVYFESVPPTS